MRSPRAYLDYNATAPVWPEVTRAMVEAMATPGNPSAVHAGGRAARRIIEDARERIAKAAGARPGEVVFTSGGTEANNLAIHGMACGIDRLIVSAIEHPSVLDAARATGLPVILAPVTGSGLVDIDELALLLRSHSGRTLVSVMAANNETGVIQPIEAVAALCREHGAMVHCDAVQSFGREDVSFAGLKLDLMTISAHKIGGPPGAGALIVRDDVPLSALLNGGGQERRRRAGTENLPGIAGFGAAVEKVPSIRLTQATVRALRDGLEAEVARLAPDATMFGVAAPRLANTSVIAVPGLSAALQVMALDLDGVAVSAGAACSSGKVERSHVLSAMGAGARAGEAIRVSLGWMTTEQEIERFLSSFAALLARHRTKAAVGWNS